MQFVGPDSFCLFRAMEYAGNTHGKFMESAWNMQRHVQNTYGICMEYAWRMNGIYTGFDGMCVDCIGTKQGICLWDVP